jgi:putative DNA primase/helicase
VILERLLSISGEDTISVDRKYKKAWTGRLQTRLLMLTNELPQLADASAALASRFIPLVLKESFLGREDPGLFQALLPERSGILSWSLAGLARLRERGHFKRPESSDDVAEAIEELQSPVSAFLRQCAVTGAGYEVEHGAMFDAWREWCSRTNARAGTAQNLGRELRAAVPGLKDSRPWADGKDRPRLYIGVGLTAEGEKLRKAWRDRQAKGSPDPNQPLLPGSEP